MTAFSLYLPESRGFSRWTLACATIIAAHAAIVASIALWYVRAPVEPHIIPAIAVSLAPVEASSPEIQNQDIAVGPTMQQADAAPPVEERKVEEKPVEQVEQPPPQPQAEVTLPPKEEKVEKVEPQPMTPAPETRAMPKNDRVAEFSVASSNAYDAQILARLQRFKRYPLAAHGASGTVMVQVELNRAGEVISSKVAKSSGNEILDREALEILHRASPFPAFPAAKPGTQDSFIAPVTFFSH
jgi:periplasmic protein TonB